jgi:Mn-dependent DtxR family transcriptional regulator
MPPPLSDAALDVALGAIRKHVAEHGQAPTLKELAAALGCSHTTAFYRVHDLKRRGLLTVDRWQKRGIRLVERAG